MGRLLERQLRFEGKAPIVRVELPRRVAWNGVELLQPERWMLAFEAPQRAVKAEYWVGNRFVALQHQDPNLVSFLTRLHMAQGAGAAWILFAGTLAGSVVLLSLSGLLLWTRLQASPLAIVSVLATVLVLMVVCAGASF